MNTVSESRFLPPFLAVGASLVLVCGGLLLLTSTSPWTPRQEAESEPPLPQTTADAAETKVLLDVAFAPAPSMTDLARPGEPAAEDKTASDGATQTAEAEPAAAESVRPAAAEPAQPVTMEATSPEVDEVIAAEVSEVPSPEPVEAEPIAAESMMVSDSEPTAEDAAAAATVTGTVADAPAVATGQPETPIVAETAATADDLGPLLSESQPAAIPAKTVSEDSADTEPATKAASDTRSDNSRGVSEAVNSETATALSPPPPPMPKRKPQIARETTAQTAPRPERPSRPEAQKQDQARTVAAPQAPAQASSGPLAWLPMALAPADKPAPAQPAARLSGAAYSSKVWAALARHKPRAGQRGSATVTFTIGFGGALSSVGIAKSSGNAKIDQLALATVRGAAPFPPPSSGPASFSIRIDFQ